MHLSLLHLFPSPVTDVKEPTHQLALDAVQADAWTIVDRMLESDPHFSELRVIEGNTLLHVAAFFGATNTAMVLLRHGADLCTVNVAGQTPVDLAFLSGNDALVAQLRKKAIAPQPSTTADSVIAPTESEQEGQCAELSLGTLPLEMQVRILSTLDVRTVVTCATVNRRLACAVEDPWLWESLCWAHWRCDSLQARRGLCTWKDVYKEQFICHRAQERQRERRTSDKRLVLRAMLFLQHQSPHHAAAEHAAEQAGRADEEAARASVARGESPSMEGGRSGLPPPPPPSESVGKDDHAMVEDLFEPHSHTS
mmetsp:Transcript_24996/g.77904  ORF Transcript_24996/g.77904 Transcript_24996/m.77904 type:complete len:310 (-) Transcript_24996:363-1292(-)